MLTLGVALPEAAAVCVEDVEVRGHIIDSLILPKILDCISARGGTFRIKRDHHRPGAGTIRATPWWRSPRADDAARWRRSSAQIADHGAVPTAAQDCRLVPVDIAGAFPEGSTARRTSGPRSGVAGRWMPVADQEMDCGIVVERRRPAPPAACR